MLSNPLQYSPQNLVPQFSGLQFAGLPQMSPGLGQPGAYNGTAQYGHDTGQAGFGQQFSLGQQGLFGQQLPFGQQGLFGQAPFAQQVPFGLSPQLPLGGYAGTHIPAHQMIPVLGQLAQQIAVQNAVAQQLGIAVHQLAHQLAVQGLQGYQAGYGGLGPQAQGWGARPQTIQ